MKNNIFTRSIIIIIMSLFFSCNQGKQGSEIDKDKLVAWCVVPFDSLNRTPQERIDMLKSLGFSKFAYDWRSKHIGTMQEEWTYAQQNGIEIISVWMWFDSRSDTIDQLSPDNEKLLNNVQSMDLKTQFWISFHENFFKDLLDREALEKATNMVKYICSKVYSSGCKVALYNHGDWFGEPENQVKIIKALPEYEIGLIYNFHHGHHQIGYYEQIIEESLPYLWCVNINGMREEGPKILPVGEGNLEKEMIQVLIDKGYTGLIGILGHVEDADVKLILQQNLKGLNSLFPLQSKSNK